MFDEDSIFNFNPHRVVQRVGNFWEKREEYRKAALAALRRREGLPTSECCLGAFYQRADGFYREPPGREVFLDTTMYPNGNGGFTHWATGTRKQESEVVIDEKGVQRTVPTADVAAAWGRDTGFEILEVSEDGKKLEDELRDLSRDSANLQQAERVSHGRESEQAPEFQLADLSDEEVDARLQEYLKRGKV